MRFLLFMLLFAGKAMASSIEFIPNDLAAARFKAQQTGKLILVKFYADWCAPCKVMDEYTWTEPALVELVEQSCVAAKIDVDNFDGISYKQHFSIERLPTTLLLDACGNEVARYENYVSPSRMVSWIQIFDKKEHRACQEGNSVALPEAFLMPIKPAPGAAADSVAAPKPVAAPEKIFIENITKPTEYAVSPGQAPENRQKWRFNKQKKTQNPADRPPTADAKPVQEQENMPATKPIVHAENHPEAATPIVTGERVLFPEPPAPPARAASSSATGSGVFWEMKKPAGFAVQVMASSTATGADEMKKLCLAQFEQQPVAVVPSSVAGDNLYRVMVGIFQSRSDAEQFKKQVRGLHRDAFVRDLRGL